LQGAKNRVANAIKQIPGAEFYIGMEGGVELKGDTMESFAWIFIQRKDGKTGTGRTGTFFLPKKLSYLILKGTELGQADDIVFGQNNTKQKMGTVGVLTENVIDRTEYYKQAVIFALIPFINPELY
jgi:inosine/xanthosine triphosphatase